MKGAPMRVKTRRQVLAGAAAVVATTATRGRPAEKFVPLRGARRGGVPELAAFRRKMPALNPPLSTTVAQDRADRL